jgi:hypothetical protein
MLRNPGIESVLRRELDSLPLPPEEQWLPDRDGGHWSSAAWLLTGSLLIGVALVAGPAVGALLTQGAAASRPPLVRPTVLASRPIAPLPNLIVNTALGYSLLLQANWRESGRWQSIPGDAALLGVATYTARSSQQELALLNRYGPLAKVPWDLTAEMWSRNGMSTLDWARVRGGCAATCTVGNAQIRGVSFLTTVDAATGVHFYYVERGDRVLAFSFIVGTPAEQPQRVTQDTLEEIVRSVGLL